MLKQVEVERQRKVNQKGMQMYTDCTFDLRVKYNETRTVLYTIHSIKVYMYCRVVLYTLHSIKVYNVE